MLNQPVRGVQLIIVQPITTSSDTDATIKPDQRNCPGDNETDARPATELGIDAEAVLFRPRLWFVSED